MKICLIGEKSGDLDEGMRNTTYNYAKYLKKNHDIIILDPRDYLKLIFWTHLHHFKPDIIHYLHGPTLNSFILVKILSIYCRKVKTIISAIHPILSNFDLKCLFLLKPHLILVQSDNYQELFRQSGIQTFPLCGGVDINKFSPVNVEVKKSIRSKYQIDSDKFLILHIGSIRSDRDVQLLTQFQTSENQVLIIGPKSTGQERDVKKYLENNGCWVWIRFISNIEDIYRMADCYFYPTLEKYELNGKAKISSIEVPLTVLEAMSCNIPVITTKFGGLPKFFFEGDGLFFVDHIEQAERALKLIKNKIKINTRKKVEKFSWEQITQKLEEVYENLAKG